MAGLNCLFVAVVALTFSSSCMGTPLRNDNNATDPLDLQGLIYLGKVGNKELYITETRKVPFHYALGFGCNYVYDSEHNMALAAIQTPKEVDLLDRYFASTQSAKDPAELVWTSGVDRLGKIRAHWASTGEEITSYPAKCEGDWSPGQGASPGVANYNCIAIWRNCEREGHGATIPSCSPAPAGTWFTPRPCDEERRYINLRKKALNIPTYKIWREI